MSSLPPPGGPPPPPPPPMPYGQMPYAPPTAAPGPPPTRRIGMWIVVAVVVVAGLGAAAYFVFGGDSDGTAAETTTVATDGTAAEPTTVVTAPALATDGAHQVWAAIVAKAAVTDDDPSASIVRCPFGELDSFTGMGSAEVQRLMATAQLGDASNDVYLPPAAASPAVMQCQYYDSDSQTQVGLLVSGRPAGDYHASLDAQLADFDLVYQPDTSHQGGTIVSFCATAKDASTDLAGFCDADWYDDQLVVAAYIGGDGQSAELVVEWLQVVLPTVVENLAAVDPTTIGFDRTSV